MNIKNAVAAKWLAAGIFALAILMPSMAQADTTVDGSTVGVTATVSGINDLISQAKNISNNADAAAISFGTIGTRPAPWSTPSQQYIEMSVNDNAPAWRVRAYTN